MTDDPRAVTATLTDLHAPPAEPAAPAPAETTARAVGRRRGRLHFVLVAYVFGVVLAGTTLPSSLYVLYQEQWGFSAGVLTMLFVAYPVGVIAILLLAGRVSDAAGRRPVLAAAIAMTAASAVIFLVAPDHGWLFPARVLSGLAAGLTAGAATAALAESRVVAPRRASLVASTTNVLGLGSGALLAGLLAASLPYPTHLVFVVYLGILTTAAVALAIVPETVRERRRVELRLSRLRLPAVGRGAFIAASIAAFSSFAMLGLVASLGASFLTRILGERSPALTGIVVFLMFGAAALGQVAFYRVRPERTERLGLELYLVGLAILVAGLATEATAVFLAGVAIGGVAAGAMYLGSLATANRLAPPDTRAEVLSAYFVAGFFGLVLPPLTVGFGADLLGYVPAVALVAIALGLLAAVSLANLRRAPAAA